jgi:uncharacterized membrane protein
MKTSSYWYERFQPALLALLGILGFTWLLLTPPGLLGKADAIGYAVCHRIAERSFFLGDRAVPLCARCSGMYLGALAGFLYQWGLGRRGGLPARRIQVIFGVFLLAFGLDGVNSYLTFFPMLPHLYQPQNGLRLLTGTLLGTALSALLVPTFHQVVWQVWEERPFLSSFRQLLVLLGMAGLIAGSIASENPILIYPLALFSIIALLILLVLAYTMLWTLLLKRENTFSNWKQLQPILLLAILTTFLQIIVIDAVRYGLTGTWQSFSL